MAISPWYVGQTLPAATIQLTYDNGSIPNLTGYSSVSLLFVNVDAVDASFTGAGTVSVPTPANGQIVYAWAAGDVAVEGRYQLRPIVLFPTGELRCDPIAWELRP